MLAACKAVLIVTLFHVHSSESSDCTFRNERLKNICDLSSWLPWDCSQCNGLTDVKAFRKRAICFDKNVSKNICLKNCGYNQTADTEYDQCYSRCNVSRIQGTTEKHNRRSSVLYSATTVSNVFSSRLQTKMYHSPASTSTLEGKPSSVSSFITLRPSTETTSLLDSFKSSSVRSEDVTSVSSVSTQAALSSKHGSISPLFHETTEYQESESSNANTNDDIHHFSDSTNAFTTTDMTSSKSISTSLSLSLETISSFGSSKPSSEIRYFAPISSTTIKEKRTSFGFQQTTMHQSLNSEVHQTRMRMSSPSTNEMPTGVTEAVATTKHTSHQTSVHVSHQSHFHVDTTSSIESSTATMTGEGSVAYTRENITMQSKDTTAFTPKATIQSVSTADNKDILYNTKSSGSAVSKYKTGKTYSTTKPLRTHTQGSASSNPPTNETQKPLVSGILLTLSDTFTTKRGSTVSTIHLDHTETSTSLLDETNVTSTTGKDKST